MTERALEEREATHPAARQVLGILDAGGYDLDDGRRVELAAIQREAEESTRLYAEDELRLLRESGRADERRATITVVAGTTQEHALRLAGEGDVVLLNFASARNPGGGFLGGARAQEEELCRCSGLYRTLLTQPTYYLTNREQRSLLYTDLLIHSPRVPFFRIATNTPLLDVPFLASVITAPAPNLGAIERNDPPGAAEVRHTFERRWRNVLAVARDRGHRTVLLGAWGCGAFRNDPVLAAETARDAIADPSFGGAFDRIVFAIPEQGERSARNLAVFREVLSGSAAAE